MKKLSLVIILVLVVAILALPLSACSSGSSSKSTTVLRLAVPWPPGDPVTNNIQEFVDKFNAQAKGYKIELHPGESLVKMNDSVDALRTGAVEMCGWPIGAFGSMDPIFAGAELPFMVNNAEADAAMTAEVMSLYGGVMKKKFNSQPVFTFTCLGLDMISTRQVKTQADWKGMLVQSVSPQSAKFIELLGGSSVPMPFPDGYQGLQKKVIEGSMQSSSMMIMFKMNEVAKYVLRGYLIPASLGVFINMDAYNKMPKEQQDLIMKLGKEAQDSTNKFFVKVAAENTKSLTDMGLTVYTLPKAERDAWKTVIMPYTNELLKAMGDDTANKFKAAAEKANNANPYVER
jgi:TRAP-type C4-dicarboxylate transport system substrate-binding protein